MKIFVDTADVNEIRKVYEMGILDGVTTNPTLIAKQNGDTKKILKDICSVAQVPVLAEPVSIEYDSIVEESKQLASISKNIYAKIPMTLDGLRAVKTLSKQGINTAVTLVFSIPQALLSAKYGAKFICPFVGRLDDNGVKGVDVVRDIVQLYKTYQFDTKVLVVSVRNIDHVIHSAQYGADAISIPLKVVEQLYKHPLTDIGIQKFIEDYNKGVKKQ
jgi:transaldolase